MCREGYNSVTMDELKTWCKGKIAHFKVSQCAGRADGCCDMGGLRQRVGQVALA